MFVNGFFENFHKEFSLSTTLLHSFFNAVAFSLLPPQLPVVLVQGIIQSIPEVVTFSVEESQLSSEKENLCRVHDSR